MSAMSVRHLRGDRFSIRIRGHEVVTDQPREQGGEDAGPTPTELFVAGLAGCVGFYAERFLRRHGLAPDGLRVECDFEMVAEPHFRVASVDLRLVVPVDLPQRRRKALFRMVDHCPVHNSLRDAPRVRVGIETPEGLPEWGGEGAAPIRADSLGGD